MAGHSGQVQVEYSCRPFPIASPKVQSDEGTAEDSQAKVPQVENASRDDQNRPNDDEHQRQHSSSPPRVLHHNSLTSALHSDDHTIGRAPGDDRWTAPHDSLVMLSQS